MKIAIAGKGGSGKTTIAGVLARGFAADGHEVLAVDADTNPNLGISLGVGPGATYELAAARQALDTEPQQIGHAATIEAVIERFGTDAPGGVRLVQVSKIDHPEPGCP